MSNKTMKGYEIFKAIANKEIKDGTQFRMLKNENIYTYRNNNFVCRYGGMNIISILNDEFEIIEEQEEIDKLEIDDNGFIHTNNGIWKGRKLDVAFAETINKLVEKVKNIKEKQ